MCMGTTRHILDGQKGSHGKMKRIVLFVLPAMTTVCTYIVLGFELFKFFKEQIIHH
jgi:hypothetical protein